ncbi:MAG: gliding motility-associated C-terminal domain-containing protein [Gemmatimonadetes bacterium]|nr:gliding motility-associated C-terminal domain-containing protein [Gemmatimonadota bacterium]
MEMCHSRLNRIRPDGGAGNAGLTIASKAQFVRPFSFAAALAVIASFAGELSAQLGYSIRGNEIVVDRSSHWEQWAVAGGTAEITGDGSVGPRFMRKEINAALNATEFENEAQGAAFDDGPGGVSAGSNGSEARFLIDGDPATTWGPDTDRPLSEWWAEVNLGRIVVASRVVVRFAEEGEGDPFLQFKVLAWRHAPPRGAPELWLNGAPDIPKYWELGRTDKPNKSRKVFEFVPDPEANNTFRPPESLIRASSNFAGDAIDRIQVIATDSDFDRASEVLPEGGMTAEERYLALPDHERGAVDHYRREPSGRETLISPGEYENIRAERRGSIRYFRRERPRVAEIEVWTSGDNLALGMAERGGSVNIEFPSPGLGWKDITAVAVDGRHSTAHTVTLFRHFGPADFVVDLGALYWIDTMQFLMDGKDAIDEMAVDVSDGSRAPDGSIKWNRAAGEVTGLGVGGVGSHFGYSCDHCAGEGAQNFRQYAIEPTRARYLRGTIGTLKSNPGGGGVLGTFTAFAEMLLYGEGFVPELVMDSDLIELGGSKNLSTISWEADLPGGTRIEIQTRSGNELIENFLYFDSNGNPVEPVDDPAAAKSKYDRLPKSKKGEVKSFFTPGGDWSAWSPPYQFKGADITSPSPREFMQIRATLFSASADAGASLHSIAVDFSDPVADRMVGEVFPSQVVDLGKPLDLSFFIRPSFSSSRQRFDELRIEATGGATMELVEALVGSDEDFAGDAAKIYPAAELEVIDSADSTLWFRLPEPVERGTDLVEVRFRPTIFSTSTSFKVAGQNSEEPGFWQRVDAGDATELVHSQTTAVLALSGNEVISNLSTGSGVITPNGDGINDIMTFHFTVSRINSEREVTLTIFDLGGSVVRQKMEKRADPRGSYAVSWPGDDDSQSLVPPGIYIARIDIDVDSASATSTSAHRLIHVAY